MEACNDHMPCPQHDLYKPIRQRLKAYVQTTTLADLAASLKAKQAWHRLREATAHAAAETGAKVD
jgi:DNA-binding IscR family transcriptional regulator